MEKNYTKSELETKKTKQLLEIIKSRNLKTSGKKEELIDRILRHQKPSYFDLLPSELKKEVGIYKIYAELNHEILDYIWDMFLEGAENDYEDVKKFSKEINKIFRKYKVKTHFQGLDLPKEEPEDPYKQYQYEFIYDPKEDIPDQLLLDLFDYFLGGTEGDRPMFIENKISWIARLNKDLMDKNAKIRLIPIMKSIEEPYSIKAVLIK